MQPDRRFAPRREMADRRSSGLRRGALDRRLRFRREVNMNVGGERRTASDRRGPQERRHIDRRRSAARRIGDRRRQAAENRILVVEAEPAVRTDMKRILSGEGYDVVEAQEGQAGLQASGETPFGGVVVNMTLPDMSGIEFVRRLRHYCPDCRIVAVGERTTYGVPDPLALLGRLADVRGLRKPVTQERLLRTVRELMRRP